MMFFLRLQKLTQIILDPILISALLKGAVAGTEHRLVLQRFNFDFIVDVGANRGQFALIARKVFPKAKILSFEPLAEPMQIFKRIFKWDPNVTLYPYALGKEDTISTIHVAIEDDSSSMLPITRVQSDMFSGSTEKETRQVTVSRLSHLIDPATIPAASLLKMDVQGYEFDVLQGCEDLLPKFSHLYIECSFIELYAGQALAYEVISWLSKCGFELFGIYNMFYDKNGVAIQGDFLFKNLLITHGGNKI
jgi:FkbM family methyltransferase